MSKRRKNEKMCFVCRQYQPPTKIYNIQDDDIDEVSYVVKLKYCVKEDLFLLDDMGLCGLCVKYLRISYKFRKNVLKAHEAALKHMKNVDKGKTPKKPTTKVTKNEAADPKIECDELGGDFDDNNDNGSLEPETSNSPQPSTTAPIDEEVNMMKCTECSASFKRYWQLTNHMTRLHKKSPPPPPTPQSRKKKHACPHCSKEFKVAFLLKEHMTKHTGEKNYTCHICGIKLQRYSSMQRHIKAHSKPLGQKVKRTPFLCNICGKTFPYSNTAQRHLQTHLGIRNYECNVCLKRFMRKHHLQTHMRVHLGEKPFVCHVCGDKFSSMPCLSKHMKSRHESVAQPENENQDECNILNAQQMYFNTSYL